MTTKIIEPEAKLTATGRRPQQRSVRSARKILDVATSLFISKGISETTVEDIVVRAGIAKGTFYHHFDSKTTLLKAITEAVLADYREHIDSEMKACVATDCVERLKAWVKASCEAYLLITPRHEIAFADEGPRWTPRGQQDFEDFVTFLKLGHTEGCWQISDPETVAIYIYKGILGAMDDAVLSGRETKSIHQELIELTCKAVGINNAPAKSQT